MMNPIKRFWEIDALRGIAIVMMIIFHFLYDLNYFRGYEFNLGSGFWLVFGRAVAVIFILLVGISLTLSYSRARRKGKATFRKYLIRGAKIFSWGLVITAITGIFLREGVVIFGILHFIGLSIVLAYPFIRLRYWNLLWGLLVILAGIFLKKLTFGFPHLLWLGFQPANFYTFDYFPLLPWFGLVLLGMFIGNRFYTGHLRQFQLPDLSRMPIINWTSFLGRNSLLIYLIHQPLLVLFLSIIPL